MPTGDNTSKYLKEYDEQVFKLCLLGATDAELAHFFEVTEQTINNWKIDHPSFFESIKNGRETADANVGNRLYERAMGFEHDSEEIKVVSDGNNSGSHIERVKTRKIYPPETIAAIFWLKNRQGKKWRDKQEIEIAGQVGEFTQALAEIVLQYVPEDKRGEAAEKLKAAFRS